MKRRFKRPYHWAQREELVTKKVSHLGASFVPFLDVFEKADVYGISKKIGLPKSARSSRRIQRKALPLTPSSTRQAVTSWAKQGRFSNKAAESFAMDCKSTLLAD